MATIKLNDNGPYRVSGPIRLLDGEGNVVMEVGEERPVFLCRCGHSADKPFCDGSHRREGFESVVRAEEPVAVGV